ncbi:amidohydrolase [Burkholderia territorii]|nr:amidohydrolase [Burkholderia territorii]
MLKATASAPATDLIICNGKIATQDDRQSFVTALAVKDGRILAVGSGHDVMRHAYAGTQGIDLNGRTVIPRLNDSHLHMIRGGLSFNLELRWHGVSTLADALGMLRRQVLRTPAPHWVRVARGWTESQFAEKRGSTVAYLNVFAIGAPPKCLRVFVTIRGRSGSRLQPLVSAGCSYATPASSGIRSTYRYVASGSTSCTVLYFASGGTRTPTRLNRITAPTAPRI